MTKEVKSKAKQTGADVRVIIKNFERLIEAVSLLFLSGVAVVMVHRFEGTNAVLLYATYVAAALVGIRGAAEFLKHLANK